VILEIKEGEPGENNNPPGPTAEEIAQAVIDAQNENEESDESVEDETEEIEVDEEWLSRNFASLTESQSETRELLSTRVPENMSEMMTEILETLRRVYPKPPELNSSNLPEDQLEETELLNPTLQENAADLPEAVAEAESVNPSRVRLI